MDQSLNDDPLVSVIIPAFNAADLIEKSVDSVLSQTYRKFELLIVNDGSTDNTLQILDMLASKHKRITILNQENQGQGAARNRALKLAKGDYVLFIDADDTIEPVTLEVAVRRALEDDSEMVHFDWKLVESLPGQPQKFNYYNDDPFWYKKVLIGAECDELLRVKNFFSVCNLYRRDFLLNNDIFFEEGRIYEDNPFVVHSISKATTISLVHSPLYNVYPHPESSTRSNTHTDKHYKDHIFAIQKSFDLLNQRNSRSRAYLAAYHTKKIIPYYKNRIPRIHRRSYIREFVDIVSQMNIQVPEDTSTNRPFRFAYATKIFAKKRYLLFQLTIIASNIVMPRYKKLKKSVRKWRDRNSRNALWSAALDLEIQKEIRSKTIVFLGFDFEFKGNSKYLFERLTNNTNFFNHEIKFVTNDPAVPQQHRLKPGDLETNLYIARAEIMIAESWIPPKVRKNPGSTWIQLWHGTPFKKMLFDSHEGPITWRRKYHKISKFRDIQNWDFLIADSSSGKTKFQTSFLFPEDKILQTGYPRVKYLLENIDDKTLRSETLERLGVEPQSSKKIILYAPTWRDYNYSKNARDSDFSYLLDTGNLARTLGEEYLIVFHDHSYMPSNFKRGNYRCIYGGDVDIQDLLLVADFVITDYSSLIFDALALEKPVGLMLNDLKEFEETRGVYDDMLDDFDDFIFYDESELIKYVHQSPQHTYQPNGYLKNKYSYSPEMDIIEVLLSISQS